MTQIELIIRFFYPKPKNKFKLHANGYYNTYIQAISKKKHHD